MIRVKGSVKDVMQGIDSMVLKRQQEEYVKILEDLRTGFQVLLVATPTGHMGWFARLGTDFVPTPSSRSGVNTGGTATERRRTHSPSISASTVEITLHAATRAGGTARFGPSSASECPPKSR